MPDDELKRFISAVLINLERLIPTYPNGNTREAIRAVHIALHDAIDEMDKEETS